MNRCKYCERFFISSRPYSEICFECGVKYNKRKRKLKNECLFCKKSYYTVYTRSKFCSMKCRNKYNYLKDRENRIKNSMLWRKENLEKVKVYNKRYASKEKGKKKHNEAIRKYEKNNKFKLDARRIARKNISISGILCENCKTRFAEHRHHFDYNYPLKVILLCHSCHKKIYG